MANEQKYDGSFVELLLELKTVIMRQLKVATLALVKSVDENNKTVIATPFPLIEGEEERCIECRYFNNKPDKESIILVLFLDRNFMNNLKRMNREDYTIATIQDTKFHSEDYGIAIQIL